MTTQPHRKFRLPRLGTLGTFLLILPSLVPDLLLGPVAWDCVQKIVSGRTWQHIFSPISSGTIGHYGSPGTPVKLSLIVITICLFFIVLFMTAARLYADPEKRLNYRLLAAASMIHLIFLLTLLSFPASALARYIVQMGFTPKRVLGIVYHCGLLGFMAVYFFWVMRRPRMKQSGFLVEQTTRT